MGKSLSDIRTKMVVGIIENLFEKFGQLEKDLEVLEDKVENISQQWKDLGNLEHIIFGSSDYHGNDGLLKRVQELEYKNELENQ